MGFAHLEMAWAKFVAQNPGAGSQLVSFLQSDATLHTAADAQAALARLLEVNAGLFDRSCARLSNSALAQKASLLKTAVQRAKANAHDRVHGNVRLSAQRAELVRLSKGEQATRLKQKMDGLTQRIRSHHKTRAIFAELSAEGREIAAKEATRLLLELRRTAKSALEGTAGAKDASRQLLEKRLEQVGNLVKRYTGRDITKFTTSSLKPRLAWAEAQLGRLTRMAAGDLSDTEERAPGSESEPSSPLTTRSPLDSFDAAAIESMLDSATEMVPALAESALQLLEQHSEKVSVGEMERAMAVAER